MTLTANEAVRVREGAMGVSAPGEGTEEGKPPQAREGEPGRSIPSASEVFASDGGVDGGADHVSCADRIRGGPQLLAHELERRDVVSVPSPVSL